MTVDSKDFWKRRYHRLVNALSDFGQAMEKEGVVFCETSKNFKALKGFVGKETAAFQRGDYND